MVWVCKCGTDSGIHYCQSRSQGNIFNRVKAHCDNSWVKVCCWKEKHAAAKNLATRSWKNWCVHMGEGDYCVLRHACLWKTLRHFWIKCWMTSYNDITKKIPVWEGKSILGAEDEWEWEHDECIFGSICTQQLGLFMILLKDCNTVQRPASGSVMGFNRKCGVTSEIGRGGELEGGNGGSRAQKELRWRLDADKPLLSPDRGA